MDIPDDITGSCYTGQMHVLFKDTTFEVPSWDGTEIVSILGESSGLYTDGGPDIG